MEGRSVSEQSARVDLQLGSNVSIKAEVRVTPTGLLAIAALVSGILLSVAPIIWSARRRPY